MSERTVELGAVEVMRKGLGDQSSSHWRRSTGTLLQVHLQRKSSFFGLQMRLVPC